MNVTRREFLLQTGACVGYALGAAAFVAGVQRFSLINALAQGSDYRALVCVFLAGGNDGNNMVVPDEHDGIQRIPAVRSASGLAIARDALLPITPSGSAVRSGCIRAWRSCTRCGTSRSSRSSATSARWCSRSRGAISGRRAAAVPAVLAFGSDRAVADGHCRPGGADGMGRPGRRPLRRARSGFPMITALSGGIFTRGQTHHAAVYRGRADGAEPGAGAERLWQRRRRSGAPKHDGLPAHDGRESGAGRRRQPNDPAGAGHRAILSGDVTLATPFPNTTLGNQLMQVAKVIKFNATSPELGLNAADLLLSARRLRHPPESGEHAVQPAPQISQAIKAFYDATVELGLERQVTTFTLSDFGRTLQPAGSGAASSAPITRGATITSLSAARYAAATSMASRAERHAFPGAATGRPERHRQSRPLDSDGVGRTVCGDSRLVVRRRAPTFRSSFPTSAGSGRPTPRVHGVTVRREGGHFCSFLNPVRGGGECCSWL